MFEKRIQIEEGQSLTLLAMMSDVAVTGGDEGEVLLRLRDGEESDLKVEETEEGPAVSARVSCKVQMPATTPLRIREVKANLRVSGLSHLDAEQVRGNSTLSAVDEASITEVYGNLKAGQISALRVAGTVFGGAALEAVDVADLQNVRGNLRVKDATSLRASRTGGNLQARQIDGPLAAGEVGGNAVLADIAGAVVLDQVAGNLVAKNLSAGARVPMIGGNLVLNGQIGVGCSYQFHARGNATLRLPEEASAHLSLSAKGKILSSVTLADEIREENALSGTLGDGGAEIAVEAKGNIMLGGGGPETGEQLAGDLSGEISRQIEESLRAIDFEAIGQQVSTEMDAALSRLQVKLESMDWDQIGIHTQRAVEHAMEQMRRNMDRMVDKAARHQARVERKLERERRRQEHAERRHRRSADAQVQDPLGAEDYPAYEPPESEPDLDEERLSILHMVEQGQITPGEAEMLLDALQ
jgi:hypothetical protein